MYDVTALVSFSFSSISFCPSLRLRGTLQSLIQLCVFGGQIRVRSRDVTVSQHILLFFPSTWIRNLFRPPRFLTNRT